MGYIKINLSEHGYAECCMCDICPICDLRRLEGTIRRDDKLSDEKKEEYYAMIDKRIKEMVDHDGQVYC